jgi:hypothetical protein
MKKIFKKLFSVNRIDLISKYFNTSNSFILEIGVHRAEFSKELLKNFNPKKLVLVDPWISFDDVKYQNSFYGNSNNNGQSSQDSYFAEVSNFFQRETSNGQVEIFRETSNNFFSMNKNKFDLIYIDGNHLYDFVKNDILNSLKSLNENGIIITDDYKLKGWWNDDVTKAVNYCIKQNSLVVLNRHSLFNYHHQCIISSSNKTNF